MLAAFALLIEGIYAARGDPNLDLPEKFAQELDQLKILCGQHREHQHEKTKKLARELLNDWAAIWNILAYPQLPITNNAAEQALRHWVIARKISYGTRTPQGSRAFTALASVIDTCRQRGISPWPPTSPPSLPHAARAMTPLHFRNLFDNPFLPFWQGGLNGY